PSPPTASHPFSIPPPWQCASAAEDIVAGQAGAGSRRFERWGHRCARGIPKATAGSRISREDEDERSVTSSAYSHAIAIHQRPAEPTGDRQDEHNDDRQNDPGRDNRGPGVARAYQDIEEGQQ